MNKIPALVIDDEQHCREYLSDLVDRYCPELSVVATASSVCDALDRFSQYRPELVFLDIHLPGESGFDFLDYPLIQSTKPWIIFTTAYDQYALKAFRYAATDYLLKPINIKELTGAVKKVTSQLKNTNYSVVTEIIEQMNAHRPVRKLCLPVTDGYDLAEIDSILYFESDGSYARVFFNDRKPLLICKPVSYYEETLNPNRFFRTHRSYLVNLDHVVSYNSDEDYLLLTDKSKITVSKRKKVALMRLIKGVIT
jgi:two-component system LytT family response regulator